MPATDEGPDSTEVVTHYVSGVGPIQWPEALERIAGWSGMWQAAHGLELGHVPLEQPWATHLWAWSGAVAARVRIDRSVHLAFLSGDATALEALAPGQGVESVAVLALSSEAPPDADALVIWQPTDGRVPGLDGDIAPESGQWTQHVVVSGPPITFLTRVAATTDSTMHETA